jgi:hypothetical protein
MPLLFRQDTSEQPPPLDCMWGPNDTQTSDLCGASIGDVRVSELQIIAINRHITKKIYSA